MFSNSTSDNPVLQNTKLDKPEQRHSVLHDGIAIEGPPRFKPAHKLYRKNGFEMIKEYPEVSIPYELRADWTYTKKSSSRKDT
jgi:hypothetical protein